MAPRGQRDKRGFGSDKAPGCDLCPLRNGSGPSSVHPSRRHLMEAPMANDQSPAVESLRREQKSQEKAERELTPDQKLERALKDTFPASDPVAQQVPITPGAAEEQK